MMSATAVNIDPNTLTAWASWVLILCTLYAVWQQNKVTKETASIQLFSDVWDRYQTPAMRYMRREFARSLLSTDKRGDPDESVLLFFETLAYLTRKGNLDRMMVWNTFSYEVKTYWAATKPFVQALRSRHNDTTIYTELEWLNGVMIKIDVKRCRRSESEAQLTDAQIREFLKLDANMSDLEEKSPQPPVTMGRGRRRH